MTWLHEQQQTRGLQLGVNLAMLLLVHLKAPQSFLALCTDSCTLLYPATKLSPAPLQPAHVAKSADKYHSQTAS